MKSSHAAVYRENDQHRSKHNQFNPTEFIQKVKGQSCRLRKTVSGLGEQHLCRATLADPEVLGAPERASDSFSGASGPSRPRCHGTASSSQSPVLSDQRRTRETWSCGQLHKRDCSLLLRPDNKLRKAFQTGEGSYAGLNTSTQYAVERPARRPMY